MGYDLVVVAGVVFLLLVNRQQRIPHEKIFATVKANGGGEIGHIGDVKIPKCFRSDFCRQTKAVRRSMELMGGVGNNKGKATLFLRIGVVQNCVVAGSGQHIDHLDKLVVMLRDIHIAQELFYLNFTVLVDKV